MTEQVLRLNYPSSLLSVPVINQLIRQFDITVNILRAQLDLENHWIEVQLAGDAAVVTAAIDWLKNQGIDVQVNNF